MKQEVARIPLAKAREKLGELVSRVRYSGEHIILTQNRTEAAVLIGTADHQLIKPLLDEMRRREDLQQARAALARAEREGMISHEEFVERVLKPANDAPVKPRKARSRVNKALPCTQQ